MGEENGLSFDVDEEKLATSLSTVKELIKPVTENVSKILVLFSTSINGLELDSHFKWLEIYIISVAQRYMPCLRLGEKIA